MNIDNYYHFIVSIDGYYDCEYFYTIIDHDPQYLIENIINMNIVDYMKKYAVTDMAKNLDYNK